MKTNRTQKGQALILIVFAVIGMIALTGLAVDGTITYSNRQSAQNAAESAALTGALDLANSQPSLTATNDATHAATTSGFTTGTAASVIVNNPPVASAACNGTLPTLSQSTGQYVQVVINTNVNTSFSSIIGVKQTHNCVDAIALGLPGSSGTMFNGSAMVATDNASGCSNTITLNSGASVTTSGGSVFDNCSGSSALMVDSGTEISSPSAVQVVGGATNNCGSSCVPHGITDNVTPALVMPAAAWALIPDIPYKSTGGPTCSGSPGTVTPISDLSGGIVTVPPNSSATISGGTYSGINLSGSSTLNFSAGNFCITGNMNENGSGNSLGQTGGATVNLVMNNGFSLSNGVTANFSDLEIWSSGGTSTINGSLTAATLRFYSTGNAAINGSGSISSGDAFIYLTSGYITMNSGLTTNLTAPTGNDPYAGLVLYMPYGNSNAITLDASTSSSFTGTILAPSSTITLNGGSSADVIKSQIIGYEFQVNSPLTVSYNAGQNYGTPISATVDLIK